MANPTHAPIAKRARVLVVAVPGPRILGRNSDTSPRGTLIAVSAAIAIVTPRAIRPLGAHATSREALIAVGAGILIVAVRPVPRRERIAFAAHPVATIDRARLALIAILEAGGLAIARDADRGSGTGVAVVARRAIGKLGDILATTFAVAFALVTIISRSGTRRFRRLRNARLAMQINAGARVTGARHRAVRAARGWSAGNAVPSLASFLAVAGLAVRAARAIGENIFAWMAEAGFAMISKRAGVIVAAFLRHGIGYRRADAGP